MKCVLLPCLALLAAAPVPSAFAQYFERPALNPDELIPLTGARRAAIGMSRAILLTAMQGEPDAKLSANVWVYWDFQRSRREDIESPEALVIIFESDKVSRIRICEEQPVRQAIAQLERARKRAPAIAWRR